MDDALPFTPAAQIVAGLLILFLGRRLFWIFVGVVGFFFGLKFGVSVFAAMPEWLLLVLSVVLGLICAGLTILLQRLAVVIAGGFAGGMLAMQLAPQIGLLTPEGQGAAFFAGGLLAAVLISVLFDPVLIVLSALIGAVMVAEALPLDDAVEPVVLVILIVVGVVAQMRLGIGSRRRVA